MSANLIEVWKEAYGVTVSVYRSLLLENGWVAQIPTPLGYHLCYLFDCERHMVWDTKQSRIEDYFCSLVRTRAIEPVAIESLPTDAITVLNRVLEGLFP